MREVVIYTLYVIMYKNNQNEICDWICEGLHIVSEDMKYDIG